MNGLLTDKVVLITGAAGGIGRAGVELAAREGARHIYVVDLHADAGADTVARARAVGGSATFVACDVTDEDAVAAVVGRAVDEHGRLVAAWNNAGINDVSRPFTELTRDDWDRMIAINLTSVFFCMKHELRAMSTHGGGAIVNTSSGAGLVSTTPGMPHYVAAKHGVLGLTKAAASEFNDRNVRVNAVCPGMVDTPMVGGWFDSNPQLAHRVLAAMPGGKLGLPAQVAEAAVWLLSDRADWVSGLSMVVDGGRINR